jgi:two-component system, LytTR family, sensor kinase
MPEQEEKELLNTRTLEWLTPFDQARQSISLHYLSIWACWTALALLYVGQTYLANEKQGREVALYTVFAIEFCYAYVWALLTPVVFSLGRKYHLNFGLRGRRFLFHVVMSLLFGLLTRATREILLLLWASSAAFSALDFLRAVFFAFDYGMIVYWLLLLIDYTVEYNRRFRAEELKASKLETQLAQAQLNALKMQLQPHFLFNTLNSISALLHQDAEAADRMVARLGELLRLTLDNSRTQEVTLEKELDYLRSYLSIEEIRFQERLSVEIQIEPSTKKLLIPNLLLQPIVENAIKHGISKQRKPGKITIRAEKQKDKLRIQVQDNGPGTLFDESSGIVVKQGFGLSSTQARLLQYYGEGKFLFDVSSAPGGGFRVTFELPIVG